MINFENIVFDEFTLLEGEQAEAYKKRKAEEKEDKDPGRNKRRYYAGAKFNRKDKRGKEYTDGDFDVIDDDNRRDAASSYVANRHYKDGKMSFTANRDAINRDMRRHPDRWKKENPSDRINTVRT